jgi:hypothetical protein
MFRIKIGGSRCTEDRECVTNNCEDYYVNNEKICMNKKCVNGEDCPGDTLCWEANKEGRCSSAKTCNALDTRPRCEQNITKCTWDASTGQCKKINGDSLPRHNY